MKLKSKAPQTIFFHYADQPFKIPVPSIMKYTVKDLFRAEGKHLKRLDYIFCSDSYLNRINIEFLNHDNFTDVITFNLSEKPNEIIGEVYISFDRVKENANHYKVFINNELSRVMIHGALHLCDCKDKNQREKQKMRVKENIYLSLLSIKKRGQR